MNFRALFEHQQRLLALELAIARERFGHHGIRGDALEKAVREFLERHIPRSLTVGTGEVVATESDTDCFRSGQVDIVLSSTSQPFTVQRDEPTTFFVEGVQLAGEIKSSLSRSMMRSEMIKSKKFKSLRAKNLSRIVDVKGIGDWSGFYHTYRPYFILAMETSSDWRSILLEILEYVKESKSLPVDGLFLLGQGIVIFFSPFSTIPLTEGQGIPIPHNLQNKPTLGSLYIYKTDVPLAMFMSWIALFRASFFDDKHAISFYLKDVINDSIQDVNLGEMFMSIDEAVKCLTSGERFDFLLKNLREAFTTRR